MRYAILAIGLCVTVALLIVQFLPGGYRKSHNVALAPALLLIDGERLSWRSVAVVTTDPFIEHPLPRVVSTSAAAAKNLQFKSCARVSVTVLPVPHHAVYCRPGHECRWLPEPPARCDYLCTEWEWPTLVVKKKSTMYQKVLLAGPAVVVKELQLAGNASQAASIMSRHAGDACTRMGGYVNPRRCLRSSNASLLFIGSSHLRYFATATCFALRLGRCGLFEVYRKELEYRTAAIKNDTWKQHVLGYQVSYFSYNAASHHVRRKLDEAAWVNRSQPFTTKRYAPPFSHVVVENSQIWTLYHSLRDADAVLERFKKELRGVVRAYGDAQRIIVSLLNPVYPYTPQATLCGSMPMQLLVRNLSVCAAHRVQEEYAEYNLSFYKFDMWHERYEGACVQRDGHHYQEYCLFYAVQKLLRLHVCPVQEDYVAVDDSMLITRDDGETACSHVEAMKEIARTAPEFCNCFGSKRKECAKRRANFGRLLRKQHADVEVPQVQVNTVY